MKVPPGWQFKVMASWLNQTFFRISLRKEMKMKTVSRIAVFHLTIVGEVAVRRYQLDQVWGAFFDELPLGSP